MAANRLHDSGRAQDFLTLLERAQRGHLKLYIGFAAGVGKTYRMLQEAHALKRRGVDVVLGYIETHNRSETTELVGDLPTMPRRQINYREVMVEEFDLDALLARKPKVAIIDELAHTNVPGCRHHKRYQDVLELLDAGISIIGAFNIQHLESLNDLVSINAGIKVRETIPDSFVKQADQVVNLDLAVEDLLERLRAGKIYPSEKVEAALKHFFQERNLSTLRELSLREVAESLDRSARRQQFSNGVTEAAVGRVQVCLSSNPPHALTLLRRGSRMAGRLATDWFVVYVETSDESSERIDAEAQRQLASNFDRARELGAEVVRIKSDSPAEALLDFARAHGVAHIMIGRSEKSWWRQLLGASVPFRLMQQARDFDLHIVSFPDDQATEKAL